MGRIIPYKFQFIIDRDTTPIHFPVSSRSFVDARLSSIDSITLGVLDALSIDLKMWADMNGVVSVGGAGKENYTIFDLFDPIYLSAYYQEKYDGHFDFDELLNFEFPYQASYCTQFNLGDFSYDWYIRASLVRMYLESKQRLANLSAKSIASPADAYLALMTHASHMNAVSNIACKSLMGRSQTIGDIDMSSLGEISSTLLWQLSGQAASAFNLCAPTVATNLSAEINAKSICLNLRTNNVVLANEQIRIGGASPSKKMLTAAYRTSGTLADIDDYTIETLDARILGMYLYNKTPAVVTAE